MALLHHSLNKSSALVRRLKRAAPGVREHNLLFVLYCFYSESKMSQSAEHNLRSAHEIRASTHCAPTTARHRLCETMDDNIPPAHQ